MSAGQLLDFGFNPQGTPLGSVGSPSMPEDDSLGLGDPMAEAEAMLGTFVKQTQRRYGDVSDINGGVWDPRGQNAMSGKPSDYKDTDMMRPDEIPVNLNQSDDQVGGDPILSPYMPDNSGFAQALYDRNMGLSEQGAATLADSLSVYDPRILDGIQLPRQIEPRVTNALGMSTSDGGLPQEFFDPSGGGLKQGMPEAINRVISQGAEYQHVDQNGFSDGYAPGTGPYDAMAKGLILHQRHAGVSKVTGAIGEQGILVGHEIESFGTKCRGHNGPAKRHGFQDFDARATTKAQGHQNHVGTDIQGPHAGDETSKPHFRSLTRPPAYVLRCTPANELNGERAPESRPDQRQDLAQKEQGGVVVGGIEQRPDE